MFHTAKLLNLAMPRHTLGIDATSSHGTRLNAQMNLRRALDTLLGIRTRINTLGALCAFQGDIGTDFPLLTHISKPELATHFTRLGRSPFPGLYGIGTFEVKFTRTLYTIIDPLTVHQMDVRIVPLI